MSRTHFVVKPNVDPSTKEPYKIRLPDKPHIFMPAGGVVVEKNKFWLRRLRDDSVVLSGAKPSKAAQAAIKE